jgi:histidine ammonia-lyase
MLLTQPLPQHANKVFSLNGNNLSLSLAEELAFGKPFKINSASKEKIDLARSIVERIVELKTPTYGINTGFGYFAKTTIDFSSLVELQANIIKSHASSYGDPLSIEETRLAMILRLNVLLKGSSGSRFELCEALYQLINKEIFPIIPEYGSVGASGDLSPLAHLALPLIGEGWVKYKGEKILAKEALAKAGLAPIELREKEGLTLINGTQIMGSVGSLGLCKSFKTLQIAEQLVALSVEALEGCTDAFHPFIHESRGHPGQIESAKRIREALKGSPLLSKNYARAMDKVQDPYSIRCAPQVYGASRDALQYAKKVMETEMNAVTDNPLVNTEDGSIISGGNFHGQPLAYAFDFASIAVCEIASLSERRLDLLFNPQFSQLPAFLSPKEGLCSGYMAAQYLSASLVNENKMLSHPCSTDSIPGNVGVEDHVSMGMTSARKLKKIVDNVLTVLCCEWVAACQACDLRGTPPQGEKSFYWYELLRKELPTLKNDRIISEDIEIAKKLINKEIQKEKI